MTTIAIANQKGGVGKTTTAVTLGHGLARSGYRTCIVDCDPQGHVALALGLPKGPGLYRMIVDEDPLTHVTVYARPRLDIVPGDKTTERAKRYLLSMDYREHVLQNCIALQPYDLILLDLAPSLDVLHVSALAAADFVLIPTRLDAMAMDGVTEILRSVTQIRNGGGAIQDYAILPTFYERVTSESFTQYSALVAAFGDRVWPPIPADVKAREAPAYGLTLLEYCPNSPCVIGYPGTTLRFAGYGELISKVEARLT